MDSFAPLGDQMPPDNPTIVRPRYRPNGTDRLTLAQADKLFEAVVFASENGLHLRGHLTVHWSLTMAFDDNDGKRAALVREGPQESAAPSRYPVVRRVGARVQSPDERDARSLAVSLTTAALHWHRAARPRIEHPSPSRSSWWWPYPSRRGEAHPLPPRR
jgi:hypothetical protein